MRCLDFIQRLCHEISFVIDVFVASLGEDNYVLNVGWAALCPRGRTQVANSNRGSFHATNRVGTGCPPYRRGSSDNCDIESTHWIPAFAGMTKL